MNKVLRYTELWQRLKDQLTSLRLARIMGPGKVYLEGENYSQPEGNIGSIWARTVLIPTQTVWPDMNPPGPTTQLAFLVRTEVTGDFARAGYLPGATLDAMQADIYDNLFGYQPKDLMYLRIVLPLFVQRLPQPQPLWDDGRRMWYTSSEWRTFVAALSG